MALKRESKLVSFAQINFANFGSEGAISTPPKNKRCQIRPLRNTNCWGQYLGEALILKTSASVKSYPWTVQESKV